MARWLAFLIWLFSFSTWQAFFACLFQKPPSLDEANHGVEEHVLSGSDYLQRLNEEEADASLQHQSKILDYLVELLSQVSSNEDVSLDFESDECGYGPLTCDEDTKVKEILEAIATSTILKGLILSNIWPMTWEGMCEALLSNQSVKQLEIWNKIGGEYMVSTGLLENTHFEDVQLYSMTMDNACAMLVSNALRLNQSLKHLRVGDCKMDENGWKVFLDPLSRGDGHDSVLEHLDIVVSRGRESHCDVHIGSMVQGNTSLCSLTISDFSGVGERLVSSIGEALHFNMQLSYLCINIMESEEPLVEWSELFTSLSPAARGQLANTTLRELSLFHCSYMNNVDEIEHDSLCNMLRSNTSLVKFSCSGLFLNNSVHVIQVLESLKSNKCLKILDLSFCEGVKGQRVLGAIMNLLDENHYLEEIILWNTPLHEDGSAEVVMATLEKRAKDQLWEVVQGMARRTPTSGRVFLCGEPFAGKTTLRKTIMENYSIAVSHQSKRSRLKALFNARKGDKRDPSAKTTIERRTRGIEVHNFQSGDVAMTIWDMAGQKDYHSFHDLVVPNLPMSGSCCSFVLVSNLAYRDDNPLHLKKVEHIITELTYWLKFIVSNTKVSNLYRPHVTVVFTHLDKCPFDSNRLHQAMADLKMEFEPFVEFEGEDFMINAKTYKDSVDGVFEAMVNQLRGLLARVPKTIVACDTLQVVLSKRIVDNPHELVLDWDTFSEICDEVPELHMMDSSNPELTKRRKEFAASSLHDRGHLIYHVELKLIIVNPHKFCHGIMGELMNVEKMSRYESNIEHGITKDDLESALFESRSAIGQQIKVALEDVLKVMEKMELCYEQEDGTIIIPSLLSDGYGKLTWPVPTEPSKYVFVGRRLTIADKGKTLLSPGFFPRLQVSFRKTYGLTCEIKKNMVKFVCEGRETIIEFSGSPSFYIDIMMRVNASESPIKLDSHERDLIKHIVAHCADPTLGCQGVKLVEYIMRPSCIENLVPFENRSMHQVVMVEILKQKVMFHGDLALKYEWPAEGDVLQIDSNDAKTLLGEQMSNDVLDQLMVDLKYIEGRILHDRGSMDIDGHGGLMDYPKALKASRVTMDDLYTKMEEEFESVHGRFDRVDRRLDKIDGKLLAIKLLQEKLLPRVCQRLDKLVTFTVEFQQHKFPRIPHFKECHNLGLKRMVRGMQTFVLHLSCEHKDGFHIVEDQNGCELSIGNESTQAFLNVVKWALRVFTLLLKVGAHVGAGMSSVVPDLERIVLVLDTLGIGLDEVNLDSKQTLMDEVKPYSSHIDEMVAEQWLIDFLEDKCKCSGDIQRVFKLRKVRYKMEGDSKAGCVAWICDKHYNEGRHSDTLELLLSYIDG